LEAKDRKIQSDSEAVINVGDFLAMHIVASRPLFLSKETVTQEVWDRERNIILSQVMLNSLAFMCDTGLVSFISPFVFGV
jgi:translation elongation factor EF-Ts